jgi:hypothetical protein
LAKERERERKREKERELSVFEQVNAGKKVEHDRCLCKAQSHTKLAVREERRTRAKRLEWADELSIKEKEDDLKKSKKKKKATGSGGRGGTESCGQKGE